MEVKRKMAKNSKRKLLFTSIMLAALLASSAYAALIPNVHAAEITNQEKGLSILSDVVGLDQTKYNATPTLKVNGPTLGALPTENIRYALESTRGHVEILQKFTNGHLQMIDVLENSDPFQMTTSPAALVGMAKAFLLNYQAYSANSFYGQLSSMLNKADATKNSTTIVGNIKFDITTTSGNSPLGDSTQFTWSYTSKGITVTGKCVSLGYKDGFLKVFIDTWNLYPIGSTTVNLSEKQAEEIAMKNARTFTWTIGSGNQTIVINNFNVTKPMVKELMFCEAGNASNARDSNQLALYPMWRVGVGLDKFYPGNVYGIYVDIWADTGQIRGIHEVFSTLPPPAGAEVATLAESSISTVDNQAPASATMSNMFSAVWMVLAAFAVFTMGAVPVWLNRKKTLHSLRLPKLDKIGGAWLCLLIGSVALVALASAVPTVNAACANIWGNSSDGSNGTLYHSTKELGNQSMISTYITSWFQSCGYPSDNYQQNGQTLKQNVLSYTQSDGQCYPSVATVYFDHGVGKTPISSPFENEWHYMLCDSQAVKEPETDYTGDIFDYEIFSHTSTDNYFFSYISTCHSASLWNGNKFNSSYTGYYGANQGGSGIIIGVPYAWTQGASISTAGFSDPDSGPYCYIGFVNASAALSQEVDNRQSGTTIYYTFVYHFFDGLLNNQLTVHDALDYAAHQAFPPEYFAATELYNGFTGIWEQVGTGWGKMVVYGNSDIYLYSGDPDYVSTPSISGPGSGDIGQSYQFTASSTNPYDGHMIRYTFDWGDGSPPSETGYVSSGVPVSRSHTWTVSGDFYVKVTAQGNYGASSWSSSLIHIGEQYQLTVLAVDQYGQPGYVPLSIDYTYVGTTGYAYTVTEGSHLIAVPNFISEGPFYAQFQYYYYDGNIHYNNPTVVSVTEDKTVTAHYAVNY
jgi:hypothetical protein